MRKIMMGALLLSAGLACASSAEGQSLRGSRGSVDKMYSEAKKSDYTFLSTPAEVRKFVSQGLLVGLNGNKDYQISGVEFPYARPATRLFVERLATQYRAACGEKLVVTSATRPQNRRPRNGSLRSVHPTGMAADLRLPMGQCRQWLENTLLVLEKKGVIEATQEKHPAHFHVAVFSEKYSAYVGQKTGRGSVKYTVRRGDSLSEIAETYHTTTSALRKANGLKSARIIVGQTLVIPR